MESNHRPLSYQESDLPLIYISVMAGGTGFEPVNDDFKDRCLRPDLANPQLYGTRCRIRTCDQQIIGLLLYQLS